MGITTHLETWAGDEYQMWVMQDATWETADESEEESRVYLGAYTPGRQEFVKDSGCFLHFWCQGLGISHCILCLLLRLPGCISTTPYGSPMAYSLLNGHTHLVNSSYHPGTTNIMCMLGSVADVQPVPADAHLRSRGPTAQQSESGDTQLRDRRLAKYGAKQRSEDTKVKQRSYLGHFDDFHPEKTGVRTTSKAGIQRCAGHGQVPSQELERRPGCLALKNSRA